MSARPAGLVLVGASAGGVEALRRFAAGLPPDLPAAVLVVLHLQPGGASALPSILDRAGPLRVMPAWHGAELCVGTIYTAVPDHHLLVLGSRIELSRGPIENGHRPGIDALFRSGALAWGPRAAGVVLSGSRDDGTAGLASITARGGLAVVQDPQEAQYRGMPDNALARVAVDRVLTAARIGAILMSLFEGGDDPPDAEPPADPVRRQDIEVEQALWTALRATEEKHRFAERMSAVARERGTHWLARRYAEQSAEYAHAAAVLRDLVLGARPVPEALSESVQPS